MKKRSFPIGPYLPSSPPLIVAEAGINHNGNVEVARQLVGAAAAAGAHIIKFQTHLPEKEMLKDGASAGYIGESFFDLLERCQLSYEDHVSLKRLADDSGIMFMSTPFCKEAADMLDELGVEAFKTGSGELTNWPFLQHVVAKGKPVIISTGMASIQDVSDTLEHIRPHWFPHIPPPPMPDIVLMNCTSTYPTEHRYARLSRLEAFGKFDVAVGQSDHTEGIATALGAVALGAGVIEKHFTLDRSWDGPDQAASMLPDELTRLVRESKQIWEATGGYLSIAPGEEDVAAMAHHSIVTSSVIKQGDLLTADNIKTARPGTGIPAREFINIIGSRATTYILAGVLLEKGQYE